MLLQDFVQDFSALAVFNYRNGGGSGFPLQILKRDIRPGSRRCAAELLPWPQCLSFVLDDSSNPSFELAVEFVAIELSAGASVILPERHL